jgi:DNA-binding NtrC family response regulator
MKKYLDSFLLARTRAAQDDLESLPTLDELKNQYIEFLLDSTFHNKTETAKILNISRTALYYRLAAFQNERNLSLSSH